ncbi:MAG: hypothetical protein IT522_13515 [Burkholderiales bacterium]|nr:hypothetical protein [Burkholderiales bacterium]
MHGTRLQIGALVGGLALALPAVGATSFFFEGDMVRGGTEKGLTGPACVLASQFKRGEAVVWRIRVRDPQGRDVDGTMVKSVTVKLADGQTFPARFGPHPKGKDTDKFWSTSWIVPADYPTGALSYTVIATAGDGTQHAWSPFKVAMSELTIIPGDVTFTK